MKKFFSLVLALVMALSLTTVAWGAPTAPACANGATCTAHEAAIGADHYDTLVAAVADATSGQTVTMLKDVTVATTLVVDGITLDGAGHKLIADAALGNMANDVRNNTYTVVKSNVGCTLKNLTVQGGWKGILIEPTATQDTLLEKVTVVESCRGINFNNIADSNVKLTVKDSTLAGWCGVQAAGPIVFENTKFVENASVRGNGLNTYDGITLNNCTFAANTELTTEDLPEGEAIAINGGTYNCVFDSPANTGTFTITGGTFSSDVSEYLAADKALVSDGAGGYVVAAETSGSTTTNTVKKDGYSLVSMDNTISQAVAADFTKTVISPKTVSSGSTTTTTYYADRYVIDGTVCWACDASIADAKLVKDGAVVAYLTTDTAVSAGVTKVASAFVAAKTEPACGEYDVNTYVVNGKNYVVGSAEYVLYNGLVVGIGGEATAEPHVFAKKNITTDNKGAIVSIKCDNCKKSFTVVAVGKVPATYAGTVDTTTLAANGNVILMGTATTGTVVTPSTDKVTSAETFDAGIAMYVGMSIMAAAGAVVLKKRED